MHCLMRAGVATQDELTTAECKELPYLFSNVGFDFIVFSGGDPLTRDDFIEIVNHASRKNYGIKILSMQP